MPDTGTPIARTAFGQTNDGRAIEEFTITNRHGARLRFIALGGIVTGIDVPDRDGRISNVTLGFRSAADYEAFPGPHFGALIGRYANRIAGARFSLDGKSYALPANDGPNTLHGGPAGFGRRVWEVAPVAANATRLTLTSADGDQGFPGTMQVAVTYTFDDDNTWRIDYEATTDAPTVINLTNHAYFNLGGEGAGSIEGHLLAINADAYNEIDAVSIPTGRPAPVAGTPFDFRQARPIGALLNMAHPQIVAGRGYDHNFVLNGGASDLALCARVYEPRTGRIMEMHTTEPGVQFYSGNFLDGSIPSPSGRMIRQSHGFCLETQHFPDSPNQPAFPPVILRPGETFRSTTTHRFSTDGGE